MVQEIKFQIEVDSQEELKKVQENLKVHIANLELAGHVKILDIVEQEKE